MHQFSAKYIPPKRMAALAESLVIRDIQLKPSAKFSPAKPPRAIQEIIDLILTNKHHSIRPLEWALLLANDETWQHTNSKPLAKALCLLLNQSPTLESLIRKRFVRAIITIETKDYPQPLQEVATQKAKGRDHQMWSFLHQLNNKRSLQKICNEEIFGKNPNQPKRLSLFLEKNHIPATQPIMFHIAKVLPTCLVKHDAFRLRGLEQAHRDYLIKRVLDCLNELEEPYQLQLSETLLIKAGHFSEKAREEYFNILAQWIERKFGKNHNPEAWRNLSTKARKILSSILGMTTYKKLVMVADKLCKGEILTLTEKELLRKRKLFWEHYQHYFLSVRFIIPPESMVSLHHDKDLKKSVSLLLDDGYASTEVFIFELEQYIIVEFIRGKSKEGRVFDLNTLSQEHITLLLEGDLSVGAIQNIPCLKVYDHCFLWQYYLVQYLTSLGLLPKPLGKDKAQGKDTFTIHTITKEKAAFSLKKKDFLTKPTDEEQQQRSGQIFKWQKSLKH